MNVLVSAYASNPYHGGEDGFGFNWAWQTAARGHHVWCLTNPDNQADTQQYLRAHAHDPVARRLRFLYIAVPAWVQFLYRWQFGVYLHYMVWQYLAWRRARLLDAEVGIELVHHATYGSLQLASWLWRLGKPLVFGPVGGGQQAPPAFRAYIGNWFRSETMRNAVGWLLTTFDPNVRQTLRRAALVLATNQETADWARRLGARRVELFLDSGLPEAFFPAEFPAREPGPVLKLLWLGRLFPRKGLPLVLEALARVPARVRFHLTIVGDGPQGAQLPGWLRQYGLEDRVTWRGAIPYEAVREAFLSHDAFMFGSLRDSFASQFMEAMALGLPIITLNHQGARDFIPDAAAIKVAVTTPAETGAALARAVTHLSDHPALRQHMGKAGYQFALTQTWKARAARLEQLTQGFGPSASAEVPAPRLVPRPAPQPAPAT